MKTYTLLLLTLTSLLSINSQGQSWQFANSFGGYYTSTDPNNRPECLEVDDDGNSYLFGNYGDGTEFNDSTLKSFDATMGSFIVKHNSAGEVVWFKAIANSGQRDDQASYMLLKDNYLYILGSVRMDNYYKTWFIDTTVIGSLMNYEYNQGNSVYPWIPFRTYSYFIKMDLDGNILDQHLLSIDGVTAEPTKSHSSIWGGIGQRPFTIDNQGNYYFFAWFRITDNSVLYCDDEALDIINTPDYGHNILKFDPDFNLLWNKSIIQNTSYVDTDTSFSALLINDSYCDAQNNLYIVGYAYAGFLPEQESEIDLDLGNGQSLTIFQNADAAGFLLKMNSEGIVQWTQQPQHFYTDGYNSGSEFESLLVDETSNSIYVEGYATPVTNYLPDVGSVFGNDTIYNFYGWSSHRDFIAKYDMDGNYHWVNTPPSSGAIISSLALYNNKLIATLALQTELEFIDSNYTFGSSLGLVVCQWDTDGNELSSLNIPSEEWNDPEPYDTRINSNGELFITGLYTGVLTFGEDTLDDVGTKMFLAKYDGLVTNTPNIEKTVSNKSFSIYPNPANDFIVIASLVLSKVEGKAKQSQAKTVGIYDLTGKLVKSSSLRGTKQSIQIGDLEKGIYFVQIGAETQKFLVE